MIDDPRNPDLEAAIIANPDDVEAYRVLADWLEGQGDIRAELIRLQIDPHRKAGKPDRALFNKHHGKLVGELSKSKQLTWRHGFVHQVLIEPAIVTALDHPSARFLAELRAAVTPDSIAPLATRLAPTLRMIALLGLGKYFSDGEPISLEALSPSLDRSIHLRRFELGGSFDLSTFTPPKTTVLKLRWGRVDATPAIVRLADRRPPLRELSLNGVVDPAAVIALLAGCEPADLRLCTSRVDEVVTALCASPAAASIRVLDLGQSEVGPEAIEALIAARPAFRALETVDLQGCEIDEALFDELEALQVAVVSDRYDDTGE